VNAFDQTREIQSDLSNQAQQALDAIRQQQQTEQAAEAFGSHQQRQSFSPPEPIGGN
jgi:hypothetical protein